MSSFHDHGAGSQEFWDKCFLLLDNVLKRHDDTNKLWKPLHPQELLIMIKILTAHDKSINKTLRKQPGTLAEGERIWKQIYEEYGEALAKQKFNNYQLYKTFVCFSNLASAGS